MYKTQSVNFPLPLSHSLGHVLTHSSTCAFEIIHYIAHQRICIAYMCMNFRRIVTAITCTLCVSCSSLARCCLFSLCEMAWRNLVCLLVCVGRPVQYQQTVLFPCGSFVVFGSDVSTCLGNSLLPACLVPVATWSGTVWHCPDWLALVKKGGRKMSA